MNYYSIEELIRAAERSGKAISDIVIADEAQEMGISQEALIKEMDSRLAIMEESVVKGQAEGLRSTSGLTGGDGRKMMAHSGIMGSFVDRAIARGIGVAEYNAAMGRIVASPTAGSCGIMPGCLISLMNEKGAERISVVRSMFTAAAIGMIIAEKASLAGASGGCQAECGSAAAMTAGAICEIMGGSPMQVGNACAIALKNQLGLVCDPVAGLVEIPCIKRNAQGVVTAMCASDMALAGISSAIPADEVIDAMRSVGEALPRSLKETAEGGLAATPTGKRLQAQVFSK